MVDYVEHKEETENKKDRRTYGLMLGMHIVGMINGGCFCAMIYSVYLSKYWFAFFFLLGFLITIPPTPRQVYNRNKFLNNYKK